MEFVSVKRLEETPPAGTATKLDDKMQYTGLSRVCCYQLNAIRCFYEHEVTQTPKHLVENQEMHQSVNFLLEQRS
jgi:hypothetical protein